MVSKTSQVYCDACRTSYWIEFGLKLSLSTAGVMRKSLIHHDHVLIVDIDTEGVVRGSQTVPLEHDPMTSLIDDVAQGFHYVNGEPGNKILIDFYTSNPQLTKFLQRIISKIFEEATTNRIDNNLKFTATTSQNRTIIYSSRVHISVGPYMDIEFGDLSESIKGIVLDINEIEQEGQDIIEIIKPYSWVAVLVSNSKKDAYVNLLTPYFDDNNTPYFIEAVSNQNLKELFDFIFSITLKWQS